MATKKWDVIVIGAGPAGSSAARTLVAGGMKCLLIERKKMPRQKMCSGILSNWAFDFVHRKFGAMPLKAYCNPNFLDGVALHFPSIDEPVEISTQSPIPNVWRSHFDHFLAESSKATIRDGYSLQKIEQQSNGFKVTCKFTRGGRVSMETFTSKYIVGADGPFSRSLRILLPDATRGLPIGIGMQNHYRGEINISRNHYNVFFYPGTGFYAWASFKDDDIHIGSGIIGTRGQPEYHAMFVSLLKEKYDFKIKKTIRKEGMVGILQGPLNVFTLGKGNFLLAGDAAGFIHNLGEGISSALTTGDLAAEAILTAGKTGEDAHDVYRRIVRNEAEICLDQFNPLRMFKKLPMPMNFKEIRENYSLRDIFTIWKDVKALKGQDYGFASTNFKKIIRKNMVHHLFRGTYPIDL